MGRPIEQSGFSIYESPLDTHACARVCTQNPATEYAIDQLMQQEGTTRIGQGEGKRHCERTCSGEMDRRVGRSENR